MSTIFTLNLLTNCSLAILTQPYVFGIYGSFPSNVCLNSVLNFVCLFLSNCDAGPTKMSEFGMILMIPLSIALLPTIT